MSAEQSRFEKHTHGWDIDFGSACLVLHRVQMYLEVANRYGGHDTTRSVFVFHACCRVRPADRRWDDSRACSPGPSHNPFTHSMPHSNSPYSTHSAHHRLASRGG